MRRRSYKYHIRKAHRFLGVFLGIQFLLWTLGGLYFSWTNIREIRGEHLRKSSGNLKLDASLVSPQLVLDQIAAPDRLPQVSKIRVVDILDKPYYEISFGEKRVLADATTGHLRPALNENEARGIADRALISPQEINRVDYVTEANVNGHHEYREKPLPAWAITFAHGPTVYIGAETGQVEAIRTNAWRVFDFLWMLHTMGYQDRDDINNYLLRAFSIAGLLTICSGFLLFAVSSPFWRKRRRMGG